MRVHIQIHSVLHDVFGQQPLSGLNATDKAPIYEMPLTFTFKGYGAWHLKYYTHSLLYQLKFDRVIAKQTNNLSAH